MNQKLLAQRALELGGLILIADGLMNLFCVRRRPLIWHLGPELVKAATEEIAAHPKTSRAVYATQVGLGLALASIQIADAD